MYIYGDPLLNHEIYYGNFGSNCQNSIFSRSRSFSLSLSLSLSLSPSPPTLSLSLHGYMKEHFGSLAGHCLHYLFSRAIAVVVRGCRQREGALWGVTRSDTQTVLHWNPWSPTHCIIGWYLINYWLEGLSISTPPASKAQIYVYVGVCVRVCACVCEGVCVRVCMNV